MSFGKRPEFEMFDTATDPYCLQNLAGRAMFDEQQKHLETLLMATLKAEGDPRIGDDPDVFERMPYADKKGKNFYRRFMDGEQMNAGWVEPTDFESKPLDNTEDD